MPDVSGVKDVLFRGGDVSSRVLFKGESSAPDDVDKDEEEDPAGDTACATREAAPIEEGAKSEGSKDLSEPGWSA